MAEAFLALAAAHPHGLRFGTFSFRSHAEAFFHWAGPEAGLPDVVRKRMGKDRAVLEELVRRVRDGRRAPARRGGKTPSTPAWPSSPDRSTTTTSIGAGTAAGVAALRRADGTAAPFTPRSRRSGVIDEPPEWFAGYRLTINLFYQLLPALDISPVQPVLPVPRHRRKRGRGVRRDLAEPPGRGPKPIWRRR